jgi:hypothetical protein
MAQDGKRRLPVLRPSDEPEPDDRPPWHWAGLGAVAIFVVWLPLAAIATSLGQRWVTPTPDAGDVPTRVRALLVGVHALAFALACVVGGFFVRRVGARTTPRHAVASGVAAAAIAWVLAATQGLSNAGLLAWAALLVVVAAIGALGAGVGGLLEARKKKH